MIKRRIDLNFHVNFSDKLNNKNYKPLKKKYAFLISLPLIVFSFIFTYTMLDKMEFYLIVLILLLSIIFYCILWFPIFLIYFKHKNKKMNCENKEEDSCIS